MKLHSLRLIFLSMVMIPMVMTFSSCSSDDEAQVTLTLKRNDLASVHQQKERYLVDRILEFFSTAAYGGTAWDDTHGDMTLLVTSPNLTRDLSFPIPPGASVYVVYIPAVQDVTFTVISDVSENINWGGHATLDLLPGQTVSVPIAMIPMTRITYISGASIDIYLNWEYIGTPYNALSYYIYRSTAPGGPYVRIANVTNLSTFYYSDSVGLVMGTIYYYRISVNSTDGEGVMCDPVSGQLM